MQTNTPEVSMAPYRQDVLTTQFLAAVDEGITDYASQKKIKEIFNWALFLHADQNDRPDGSPYTTHITRVALNVMLWGIFDVYIILAALLHDAVEDQWDKLVPEGTAEENARAAALLAIEARVGTDVADIVDRVTNPDFTAQAIAAKEAGDSRSVADIKNDLYVKKVRALFKGNPSALIVKLADFYENGLSVKYLPKGERRDKLSRKYAPLISAFYEEISNLTPEHPLYASRDRILADLSEAQL